MKRQYFKTIVVLLLIAVLAPMRAATIEFTVNGINYKTTSAWEVEVAPESGDYQGAIVIPGSVTYNDKTYRVTGIGSNALSGPGITSVTLPAGTIRTIKEQAFYDCHNLASLVIPASVTLIDYQAFLDCYHLKDLYFCTDDPPTIDASAFTGVNTSENTCTVHVPSGRQYYYKYNPAFDSFTQYANWDAPEIYGVTVAGCVVTAENKGDVLGDGKVTFNTTTTTLTIGADIVTTELEQSIVDNSSIFGLTILFDNCSLTATNATALHMDNVTTLKGTATIEGGSFFNAVKSSSDVAIIDATINFRGVLYGSNYSSLIINNSNVKVDAPETQSAIAGFNDLLLTDCYFQSPVDATYIYDGIVTSIGDPCSIVIKAGAPLGYNLWLAGTQVTELNCANILGYGEASYDPAKNELTLNGYIEASGNSGHERYAIDSQISGLTINVNDNVMVSSNYADAVIVAENTVIKGNYTKLTVTAPYGQGIYARQGSLTIKDANVLLDNCKDGIIGVDQRLNVENSTVEGSSISGKAVISGFSNVYLTDCLYTSPDGVFYDNDSRQLMDINGNVAASVKIVPGEGKTDKDLSFPRDTYLATVGKAFTAPELKNPDGLTVTYSSSNTDVATVANTGAVTIKGRGVTIISATFAGTAQYNPKRVSYNLVVSKSEGLQYDANQDGTVSITDAVSVVNAILNGVESAPQLDAPQEPETMVEPE